MNKRQVSFSIVVQRFLCLFLCFFLLSGVFTFSSAEGNDSVPPGMADTVNALLLQEAEKTKDAWQKAILESGAELLSVADGSVTFRLRGYDPQLKSLGAYADAEDPSSWLMSALRNASAYDLEITAETDGETVSKKGQKAILTSVGKAASAAKKAFSSKDFTAALKDYLFPLPVSGKVKDASDLSSPDPRFSAWYADHQALLGNAPEGVAVAAFYLQKSQKLSVKNGPNALTLSCVGEPLSSLVDSSIREIKDSQAYLPLSSRTAVSDPEPVLERAFLSEAFPAEKKAKLKTDLTLDIDSLLMGELPADYLAYFSSFSWNDTISSLSAALSDLPDLAAQKLPKFGVLTGENRGTRVIIKLSDDSNPTYIVMRDANTDRIVVSAMAQPGKGVTVRVPQGFYYLAWCSGPYWYGDQELFSTLGNYNRSERVEILGPRYYHTFKLAKNNRGNTSIYGANPDDFR